METLYWQYPQTAGDLPFGTVVGKNIMAPLHDHLSGAGPILLEKLHHIRVHPDRVLHTTLCTHCRNRSRSSCILQAAGKERGCTACWPNLNSTPSPHQSLYVDRLCGGGTGWKVDLDVLGVNNTFVKQSVKVGTYEEALKAQEGADNRGSETVAAAGVPLERPPWFGTAPDLIKHIQTDKPGKEVRVGGEEAVRHKSFPFHAKPPPKPRSPYATVCGLELASHSSAAQSMATRQNQTTTLQVTACF